MPLYNKTLIIKKKLTMAETTETMGCSAYHAYKMAYNEGRRPSNAGIVGVIFGAAALVLGGAAWIGSATYTNAKAKGNESLIASNAAHTQQIENLLASQIAANRSTFETAKAAQDDINLSVNQSQSGTQSTSVSQSALAQAEANLLSNALTGNIQSCPQKVALYQPAMPCSCNNCNG